MGTDTGHINDWTVSTLHQHIQAIIDERDKRYEALSAAQKEAVDSALKSAQMAVDKAEGIAEKWRLNANEWRAAMSDKDRQYLTKAEAKSDFRTLLAITGLMVTIMTVVVQVLLQVVLKHP